MKFSQYSRQDGQVQDKTGCAISLICSFSSGRCIPSLRNLEEIGTLTFLPFVSTTLSLFLHFHSRCFFRLLYTETKITAMFNKESLVTGPLRGSYTIWLLNYLCYKCGFWKLQSWKFKIVTLNLTSHGILRYFWSVDLLIDILTLFFN